MIIDQDDQIGTLKNEDPKIQVLVLLFKQHIFYSFLFQDFIKGGAMQTQEEQIIIRPSTVPDPFLCALCRWWKMMKEPSHRGSCLIGHERPCHVPQCISCFCLFTFRQTHTKPQLFRHIHIHQWRTSVGTTGDVCRHMLQLYYDTSPYQYTHPHTWGCSIYSFNLLDSSDTWLKY